MMDDVPNRKITPDVVPNAACMRLNARSRKMDANGMGCGLILCILKRTRTEFLLDAGSIERDDVWVIAYAC